MILKKLKTLIYQVFSFFLCLFSFKYLTFFSEQINKVFRSELLNVEIALPIGISFFTFQLMSYLFYPYMADSVTDFWRRWHISLSTWFRDYVYIPLGGNKVSKCRWILNLFIVWLLTGMWHGANWTFILWGMIYFVFLFAGGAIILVIAFAGSTPLLRTINQKAEHAGLQWVKPVYCLCIFLLD